MTPYRFTIETHKKLVSLVNEILLLETPLLETPLLETPLLETPSKEDSKTSIPCQIDDHRQPSSTGEQSQAQFSHQRHDVPTDCIDTSLSNLILYRERVLDYFAKLYSEMEQMRQKMLMELGLKAPDQSECQASNCIGHARYVGHPIPGMTYHLSRGADTKDALVIMLYPGSTGLSLAEENARALENLEVCCRYIPATNTRFCLQDLEHSYPVLHCYSALKEVEWVPVEKLTETDLTSVFKGLTL